MRALARRAAAGCAATAALLLAGCQAPGTSSAGGQPPVHATIIVAAVPGIETAPLYIAHQQGFFRQAGLTVRFRSYPSVTAEVSALRSGAASVAVGDYADFFFAQEQDSHAPMVVVADGYDAGPNVVEVLALPGSGIVSAQDLVGKTIGTASPQLMPDPGNGQPYSLDTVAAASVLTNDGIQPAAVTWRPMPATSLVAALRSHRVDAILATEPQISQAQTELGAQSVFDACSGETVSLPLDGYFALASFARQHHAPLAAFRAALMRAQADAAQPARLDAALTRYAGMGSQTAAFITVGVYPTALKAGGLQRVANLMSFYGALPHSLNVGRMIFR